MKHFIFWVTMLCACTAHADIFVEQPSGALVKFDNLSTAKVAAAGKTLRVSSQVTVNNLTVPKNTVLRFDNGGAVYVNSGKTLNIVGSLQSAKRNIFKGAGTVLLAGGPAYPEYWGDNTSPGATDMTAAIQGAINSNPAVYVELENVPYLLSNIYITSPVKIEGKIVTERPASGKTLPGTKLLAKTGTLGALIDISSGSNYQDYEGQLSNVQLRNLSIDGNGRAVNVDAIKISNTDRLILENVSITDVKYSALNFYTAVRESNITNLNVRYCGSIADDKPAIDLREHSTLDGNNWITFQGGRVDYSYGNSVEIDTYPGIADNPRDIKFIGMQFHGLIPAIDGYPYAHTSAQKQLKHLVIGKTGNIYSTDTDWFAGGTGVPTILMKSTAVENSRLIMVGGSVDSHYAYTGDYHGIDVQGGSLSVSGTAFAGHSIPIYQTGGNVRIDPSVDFRNNGANPTLIDNATYTYWPFGKLDTAFSSLLNLNSMETNVFKVQGYLVRTLGAQPTTGTYNAGDIVLTVPSALGVQTWSGGALAGLKYTLLGWRRMTTGSAHVLNTDWVEMRVLTGQ